jgi:hypothetical protein
LLPNTTRETYVKALNYVKEECSKVKDFFPKSVTADFELAVASILDKHGKKNTRIEMW